MLLRPPCCWPGPLLTERSSPPRDAPPQGFEPQIRRIIAQLPAARSGRADGGGGRQTLFFTATWPTAVRKLAADFLNAPVQVTVGSAHEALTANKDISQLVEVLPSAAARDGALIGHINRMPAGSKVSHTPRPHAL